MSKKSRVVSVKFSRDEFDKMNQIRENIEARTKLPVSLHYLIKKSITDGFEELIETYLSGFSPNTRRL
jgi:hypothetical protein